MVYRSRAPLFYSDCRWMGVERENCPTHDLASGEMSHAMSITGCNRGSQLMVLTGSTDTNT